MKAQIAVNTAINLLGYDGQSGSSQLSSRLTKKAVTTVNRVYSDLHRICGEGDFKPITSLNEEIKLPERAVNDVLIYGLAMFFAQSESDGEAQLLYRALYNQKRTSLTRISTIKDVLPRGEE